MGAGGIDRRYLMMPHVEPGMVVGLFGASTGGGAALMAAARRPKEIRAVVSRGGRPDLAGDALGAVTAPTLLIVGGNDQTVIEPSGFADGSSVAGPVPALPAMAQPVRARTAAVKGAMMRRRFM